MFDFTKSKKSALVSRYMEHQMQKSDDLNAVCHYYNKTKEEFTRQGRSYEFKVMELTDTDERCLNTPSVVTETLLHSVIQNDSCFLIGQTEESRRDFIMDVYDGVDPEGVIRVENGEYKELTLEMLRKDYERDMFLSRTDNTESISSVVKSNPGKKKDKPYKVPTGPKVQVVSVHDPSTAPLIDGPFEP